jgi:phosphomannomutase / phosphoglucomutase
MVPAGIFREYDIRGLAEMPDPASVEITQDVVYDIGRAFATLLAREGKKHISVGHDLRRSSEWLLKSLLDGLRDSGMDILDIGLIPTPVLYFSVSYLGLDGGISLTASHNPPEFNGMKFHLSDRPVYGKEIQEIRKIAEKRDFVSGKGQIKQREILEDYKKFVLEKFRFRKKIKVVVDAGHGMGGIVAPDLFRRLGHEVIELYTNLDPSFPDHHPDPTVLANMRDLQKKVTDVGANVGIAFDGDADRIGVVDEKGQIIMGDRVLLLYARALLKRKPGATIIGDVKSSKSVYDDITRRGGNAVMWKTGHSLIKAKIKEIHADLAGEMSGHMFFVDRWLGFDDAIYAACRMLEILDENETPLSGLLSDLPPLVSTPEIRVDCPDEKKFEIVRRAVEEFKKKYKVIDIDGARIEFEDGWGLVRASNTQAVLVMRFEATSQRRLDEIRALVENQIQSLRRSV